MYRNSIDLLSDQKVLIDAGSLWRRDGDIMILDDEDQYITATYADDIFYEE